MTMADLRKNTTLIGASGLLAVGLMTADIEKAYANETGGNATIQETYTQSEKILDTMDIDIDLNQNPIENTNSNRFQTLEKNLSKVHGEAELFQSIESNIKLSSPIAKKIIDNPIRGSVTFDTSEKTQNKGYAGTYDYATDTINLDNDLADFYKRSKMVN